MILKTKAKIPTVTLSPQLRFLHAQTSTLYYTTQVALQTSSRALKSATSQSCADEGNRPLHLPLLGQEPCSRLSAFSGGSCQNPAS